VLFYFTNYRAYCLPAANKKPEFLLYVFGIPLCLFPCHRERSIAASYLLRRGLQHLLACSWGINTCWTEFDHFRLKGSSKFGGPRLVCEGRASRIVCVHMRRSACASSITWCYLIKTYQFRHLLLGVDLSLQPIIAVLSRHQPLAWSAQCVLQEGSPTGHCCERHWKWESGDTENRYGILRNFVIFIFHPIFLFSFRS